MRDLVGRLKNELFVLRDAETSFPASEFPTSTKLLDGERVEWVSSTWTGAALANVFECVERASRPNYLIVFHGEGGLVTRFDGPFDSLDQAQQSVDTDEGWSVIRTS